MSAYIHPPGVVNPSPWEQALAATKQDTGGNAYGGNPWANYNTPQDNGGFNYTQDQYYNAAADRPQWDLAQSGAGSETDRARVWRWTLDQLKGQGLDPGKADQATVQRAYLANIGRLKRDYQANGMNWAGSAYAGYDQFLGGQPGATQQGGTRGGDGQGIGGGYQGDPPATQYTPGSSMPGGGMSIDYAAGQQGGGTVDPSAGRNSVGNAGQAAGQAASSILGGTSSPTGGTSRQSGAFGQLGNVDPTFAYQAMQQDPGVAAHYLRLAAGQGGPVTGQLGQFRDSLYGRALQAFLALGGVGGNKGGFGGAQDFLSAMQGGDIQGLLNGAASNAAGSDFTGVNDATTQKILAAAIALKSLGTGTLGSSLMTNDLNNLLYQQEGAGIQDNGGASQIDGGLGRMLGSSPYGQALQQYLALR